MSRELGAKRFQEPSSCSVAPLAVIAPGPLPFTRAKTVRGTDDAVDLDRHGIEPEQARITLWPYAVVGCAVLFLRRPHCRDVV